MRFSTTVVLLFYLYDVVISNPRRSDRLSAPYGSRWWEALEDKSSVNVGGILATREENTDEGVDSGKEVGVELSTSDFNKIPVNETENSVRVRTGEVECNGPGTVCVPYYQCEEGNVITDGTGLIDIRVGENIITTHSKCGRYLEVCCKKPNYGATPPPTPSPHEPGCGHKNSEGVHARITGLNVTQTQFGEYPWMVAILRIESIGAEDVNLYLCGGSLIQPNVVLTAAHCVNAYGVRSLKVRAGEWDTQSDYEIYPHQDRLVSHVVVHPDFDGGSLWYDYAVLILESPFELAPNVDTICLPEQNETFDHVTCYASGWGKDKFGEGGRFQNILKQVSLKIVPHRVCENALKTTRLGQYFELHSSFLCAGGKEGVDTCKGDGGSPLVCARPISGFVAPTYYQIGIVAWGIGCGEDGIPGVYADVTNAVEWIYKAFTPYLVV